MLFKFLWFLALIWMGRRLWHAGRELFGLTTGGQGAVPGSTASGNSARGSATSGNSAAGNSSGRPGGGARGRPAPSTDPSGAAPGTVTVHRRTAAGEESGTLHGDVEDVRWKDV